MTTQKIIKFFLLAVATVLLSVLWFSWADATPATHADCVAYWSQRTATWDNAPNADKINDNAVFCGGVL